MEKLSVAETDQGRYLQATEHINKGDVLVAVPREAAICVDSSSPQMPQFKVFKDIPQEYWATAAWEVRLGLMLLDDRLAGARSHWSSYIASLPENPATVLWAYETKSREAVREQLSRVGLLKRADDYHVHIVVMYETLKRALPAAQRDLLDRRSFCWAISCAHSRAFGLPAHRENKATAHESQRSRTLAVSRRKPVKPSKYALLPGLDMGNHSMRFKNDFSYTSDEDTYLLRTGLPFDKGVEVFLNYGPKSSAELVLFYGFVEGNNPGNTIDFDGSWIRHARTTDKELWREKYAIFKEYGLWDAKDNFVLRMDKVDPALMMALRIMLANRTELSVLDNMRWDESKSKYPTISLDNELRVWKYVEEHCEHLLRDVGPREEYCEKLTATHEPLSIAWRWGAAQSAAEDLFHFENNQLLRATIARVRHFRTISEKVGRICTVLVPPSQSLLNASIFDVVGLDPLAGGSGVDRFVVDT